MPNYDDEIYRGLGRPTLGLNDILHDDDTSPRKFTKSYTFSMSPEMYQAFQEVIHHNKLPFNGNAAAFARHAFGNMLESLELFLAEEPRTIFRSLMNQQRRMTRERFIVTIEDAIDQQVEILRFWTAKAKWAEVARTMEAFAEEVGEYPVAVWREHAAAMWLRNGGLKELLRIWAGVMKDDSPDDWQKIEAVWKRLERTSGD